MGEAERPKVEQIEDELDQWGRPKKKLANPIDVMPDDMQVRVCVLCLCARVQAGGSCCVD